MEEGGWSWRMRKNNGIEEIQRGKAEAGVCVFSRCLSAPFTTWRTLKTPQPIAFFPPPSQTPVNAHLSHSRTARARERGHETCARAHILYDRLDQYQILFYY